MSKKKVVIILSIILVVFACLFGVYSINNFNNTNTTNIVELSKEEIDNKLEELKSDIYEDGTYDLETLEIVSYNNGYQVSFYQENVNYTIQEYMNILKIFLENSSDGVISAGKYNGNTELSFNIEKLDKAVKLAQEYNQISIWDWQNNIEIEIDYN